MAKLFCVTLTACVLMVAAQGAQGQSASSTLAPSDELRFNGNPSDQQTNGDTQVIEDSSVTPPRQNEAPEESFWDSNLDQNQDQQQLRPSPFDLLFPSHHYGFGPLRQPLRPSNQSPMQLFIRPAQLFDSMNQHARRFESNFERQFRDLERQAANGEHTDVSYFQRNGVAYVKTCTTKRVQPEGQTNGQQDRQIESQTQSGAEAAISSTPGTSPASF